MLPAQRRRQILADIEIHGGSTIIELSQKYKVSEMTVRRDLQTLEEEGLLKRTHGGAIRSATPTVEPRYASKQKLNAVQKISIARYAAEKLVDDGDVIILEGGTTVTTMARYLAGKENLTVVTNGLYTTNELQYLLPHASVICTGGILREVSSTFVGPVTERYFQEFHANKLFLSTTGLTLETGYTDPSMLETQVKKAMISSVNQVIMLLDSSKFGLKSLVTVLPADGAHTLVTDEAAPEARLQALRDLGVDVHVTPT